MIKATQHQVDQEREGETELVLVGLKYTGDRSSIAAEGPIVGQGGWPSRAPLNAGVWQFALVPDDGLGYLESRNDLEVVYADDRGRFAEVLLSLPRLPDEAFGGRRADPYIQERVFEALGLDEDRRGEPQLRELAGDEEEPEPEEDVGRVQEVVDAHTREELKEKVKEAREDADEFAISGAKKRDMAEFLAEAE